MPMPGPLAALPSARPDVVAAEIFFRSPPVVYRAASAATVPRVPRTLIFSVLLLFSGAPPAAPAMTAGVRASGGSGRQGRSGSVVGVRRATDVDGGEDGEHVGLQERHHDLEAGEGH